MPVKTKSSEVLASDASLEARRKALFVQRIVSMIPLFACILLGGMYIISALANGYDLRMQSISAQQRYGNVGIPFYRTDISAEQI